MPATDAALPPGTGIAIVSVEWDVVDLVEACGHAVAGFFDPRPDADTGEFPHLGPDGAWTDLRTARPALRVALAVDVPRLRAGFYRHYEAALVGLRSPRAHVSDRVEIGRACILQHGVTVMPRARIGRACKLHVNATVHHDARIGDFVTLAPGALVLGSVIVEDEAYIGAGAVIRQRCRLGRGAVVGAGAVVVRDVLPGATVVGVPARPLRPQ